MRQKPVFRNESLPRLEANVYSSLINNMKSFSCALVTLSCCLLTWSSVAHAQEDPEEGFRKEVLTAQEAFESEDFELAIVHLKRAHMLKADGRLFINIARSYEKLDDCVQAIIYYNAFLNSPNPPASMAKSIGKTVRSSKIKCKAYSDSLAGRLTIFTNPKGAQVTLNGEEIGQTPLEIAGIESGGQTLKIEMEGRKSIRAKVQLDAGTDRVLKYNLKEAQASASTGAEEPGEGDIFGPDDKSDQTVEAKVPRGDDDGLNVPALALIGAGAASLGVAIYLDLGLPDIDEQRVEARSRMDEAAYDRLTEERQDQATISLVTYVAGGVLVAGGITWLLIDLVSDEDTEASLQMAPAVAPGYAGFGLHGRF